MYYCTLSLVSVSHEGYVLLVLDEGTYTHAISNTTNQCMVVCGFGIQVPHWPALWQEASFKYGRFHQAEEDMLTATLVISKGASLRHFMSERSQDNLYCFRQRLSGDGLRVMTDHLHSKHLRSPETVLPPLCNRSFGGAHSVPLQSRR